MKQLFFDFDGTIADSAPGIIGALHYTMQEMQLPDKSDAEFQAFIGPVLTESLHQYYPQLDDATVVQAVKTFQVYYQRQGWREMTIYPTIPAALKSLQDAGYQLNVASAKPEVILKQVLPYYHLAQYFTGVYGATLDESIRSSKTAVLAYALEETGATPATSLMIGDRDNDVQGGHANGLRVLGVTYGFGSRAELIATGADAIVATPEALLTGVQDLFATTR